MRATVILTSRIEYNFRGFDIRVSAYFGIIRAHVSLPELGADFRGALLAQLVVWKLSEVLLDTRELTLQSRM